MGDLATAVRKRFVVDEGKEGWSFGMRMSFASERGQMVDDVVWMPPAYLVDSHYKTKSASSNVTSVGLFQRQVEIDHNQHSAIPIIKPLGEEDIAGALRYQDILHVKRSASKRNARWHSKFHQYLAPPFDGPDQPPQWVKISPPVAFWSGCVNEERMQRCPEESPYRNQLSEAQLIRHSDTDSTRACPPRVVTFDDLAGTIPPHFKLAGPPRSSSRAGPSRAI